MKRFLVTTVLAVAAVVLTSNSASAQNPNTYGFLPFGFYQPYGARYGTSIRTPPYFATNPPVYYGARHSRPYGISPFASPPMVSAGHDYESRLRIQFQQPHVPTPQPLCNPCVSHSKVVPANSQVAKMGQIRSNPFVEPTDHIAQN